MDIIEGEKKPIICQSGLLTPEESLTRGYEDTPEKVGKLRGETDLLLKDWGHVLRFGDPYYNVNLTKVKEDFSMDT